MISSSPLFVHSTTQHNRAAAANSLPVNSILPHLPRQPSSKFNQKIKVSLHGRKRTRKRRENEEIPPFAKRLIDRKEERDGGETRSSYLLYPQAYILLAPPLRNRNRNLTQSLTLSSSAADLSTETGLDGGDGTTRSARVAGNEVQTVLSLVELCVGAAAGLAGDVLD